MDLDKTIRKYKQLHGFKIDDEDIVFVDHVDKIKPAAATVNTTDNENINVALLKGMYINKKYYYTIAFFSRSGLLIFWILLLLTLNN